MSANENIRALFEASITVKQQLLQGQELDKLVEIGDSIVGSVKKGGKVMLAGNGGSAADAQHLAAELLVRLRPKYNRAGVPALALAQDTSTITACGNDFGYDALFERMLETLGREGDVFIGISTSGNSNNVNRALLAARNMGITTVGFLGAGGGIMIENCDLVFMVPGNETGRIQECHITAGHALMEYVEDKLVEDGYLTIRDKY